MTEGMLAVLLAAQIAMGAFDTLFHHEFTERLAWRASAARELALHSVRNGFYAGLFLLAAWSQPHGAVATLILAVLAVELVITLWDFVEEDLTRRLPATERITHTLLAVNYGAILAFIAPLLWDWSALPTGLSGVSRGYLSWLLTLAAVGVGVFGIRDWFASMRAPQLAPAPAAPLADALSGDRRRVLITGATGFIGSRLVAALVGAGHDVVVLVRSRDKAAALSHPLTVVTSLDQIPADLRIDAVVNLAGSPVADAPWTRRNRHRILRSRLKTGLAVERLIARLETKPAVLVAGSAIGFYGDGGDDHLTEADRPRAGLQLPTSNRPSGAKTQGFAHRSCAAVETAAFRVRRHGVRVVALRTGLVLDHTGGMLARMLPAFDLCGGGRIGTGRQWMSWISRDDLVRLIVHAIANDHIDGALNGTAPAPVRNSAFTAALGRALGRPALFVIPAWPLRLVLREMGEEILLASQRVLPAKALGTGFVFRHPTLDVALAAAVGAPVPVSTATTPSPEARATLASAAE